jgi:hypothetical protein
VNQPCLTLLAATDRNLLSLLDAHLVRVTDSPPSRGLGGSAQPDLSTDARTERRFALAAHKRSLHEAA